MTRGELEVSPLLLNKGAHCADERDGFCQRGGSPADPPSNEAATLES